MRGGRLFLDDHVAFPRPIQKRSFTERLRPLPADRLERAASLSPPISASAFRTDGKPQHSAGCDEAFQFAQSLQTQFHGTEALRVLKLGSRAEYHAQRDFRRPVLI